MTKDTLQNGVGRKTIIVTAVPRSGSNHLCALMATTGKLGNPTEYFNSHVPFEHARNYLDRRAIVQQQGTTPNGVTAIKVFADHWDELSGNFLFSDYFPDRHWIWLRRQDLLAQAISRVIAIQTEAWVSNNPRQTVPVYSARAIIGSLNHIAISESRWRLFFARNDIRPHTLWYEDLIASPVECVLNIGAFAGINISPSEIQTDVHTKIQRSGLNREWRERFLSEMADINYLEWPMLPGSMPRKGPLKRLWKAIKHKWSDRS